jgi:hypothetical protein
MKRAALSAAIIACGAMLAGCPSSPQAGADGGSSGSADATVAVAPRPKKIDLDACDAGVQELERIARAAKKTCTTHSDCSEWVRYGNCGSLPVAKPFPPPESAARWDEVTKSVGVSCPDEPKCKWASLGVECRAGTCVPSLEGRLEPDAGR